VARVEAAPPPPPPPPPAKPLRPREPCGPTDREFESWFHRTFGGGYEVFHDGPDPDRIKDLAGEPKAEAERMLRRGLAACSIFAVQAIEGAGWRELVPDLARAVAANNSEFRADAILALKALGSTDDFTDELIDVLSSGSAEARISAAMGARRFSLDRFRGPLLERVRQDRSWLVRTHAAQSLYELADIYPRALIDHPAIAAAVEGDPKQLGSPMELLGLSPPLTAEKRARLAAAADQLDAEISARLAAGRCSKPGVPATVDLYFIPIQRRPVVALTVEASIGSCERKLAFVAFLESPGGFSQWVGAGISGRDPVRFDLKALPKSVPVAYARASGVLTVGTLTLDTAQSNVAVLYAGPNGVTARYQGRADLTFARAGRPAFATGVAVMDFEPEIAMALRTLVDGTPELRRLVRGGPPAP
jgi:hypothetical protein